MRRGLFPVFAWSCRGVTGAIELHENNDAD